MSDNFNPDDPALKNKAIHISGNAGGVLVGQRHSEGGIKAINKSTGQPLEMEGGEVVITRNAVSDTTKREFNGEMLTNRQILSRINESGGGIQFAEDGAELPTEIFCSGNEYKFGGKTMSDFDIVNNFFANGGQIIPKNFPDPSGWMDAYADDLEAEGATKILSKYLYDADIKHEIKVGEISEVFDGKVEDSFFPHFWIETDIDGETYILDYKSRLWMDEDAPEGIFKKSKTGSFKYDGMTKMIPRKQIEELFKIQSR